MGPQRLIVIVTFLGAADNHSTDGELGCRCWTLFSSLSNDPDAWISILARNRYDHRKIDIRVNARPSVNQIQSLVSYTSTLQVDVYVFRACTGLYNQSSVNIYPEQQYSHSIPNLRATSRNPSHSRSTQRSTVPSALARSIWSLDQVSSSARST